jgi:hypothetical protein
MIRPKGNAMLRVSFKTCGAAFGDTEQERREECARILRIVVQKLETTTDNEGPLMDLNGNKVGDWYTDRSCGCPLPKED